MSSLARALSPMLNGPAYDVHFPEIYPSHTFHVLPFILCCASLLMAASIIRMADPSKPEVIEVDPDAKDVPDERTKLIN